MIPRERGRIYVPSAGPDSWKPFLAKPEKQWVTGYSARTLAHCWENAAGGFPDELQSALERSSTLASTYPLCVFPEHQVPLPGGATASQSDIWVLAKNKSGVVSMAVEGKVEESFGPQLGEWKKGASSGKVERLSYLTKVLGLSDAVPDSVYYQLLHRAASAVIEAERFDAKSAVMVIHSFSGKDDGFPDFGSFVGLYGQQAEIGTPTTVNAGGGIPLTLLWVRGDQRFLTA